MPAGPRIRGNNSYGITTDNPLTIGATTFNSAGLATLPVVSSAHAVITLDPLRQFGEPEIVVVTAHTASATVATITRGQYGTVARSHPQGTVWVHAPITEDVTSILTSGTRPSDPYRGESIFETDTNRYVGRSTADVWQQEGLFFDPPACRVFHNTTQSLVNTVNTALLFNSERYDTDSMHSTSSLTTRITFNTPGIYTVGGNVGFATDNDYSDLLLFIRVDGDNAKTPAFVRDINPGTAGGARLMSLSMNYKFSTGQYVELMVAQTNTSGAANNIEAVNERSPEFWATWIGRGNVI